MMYPRDQRGGAALLVRTLVVPSSVKVPAKRPAGGGGGGREEMPRHVAVTVKKQGASCVVAGVAAGRVDGGGRAGR